MKSLSVPDESGRGSSDPKCGRHRRGLPSGESDLHQTLNACEVSDVERFRAPLVCARRLIWYLRESGRRPESERDGTGAWGYNPKIAYFEGRLSKYSWQNPGFPQADTHPVVNVTWNDAVEFSKWLSQKEGRKYRLPTEAEWEYACRAGTSTRYHCGDEMESLVSVANVYDAVTAKLFPQFGKYALTASDGCEFTSPVCSFRPNAWGLYDMHGNVWEWCSDWYGEDYYSKSPENDPQGPSTGIVRVRRGGSWHSWPLYLRSTFRNYNTPETRYVLVGFRVALEQP